MIVEAQRGDTKQIGSQGCSPGNDAKLNPERHQEAEEDIQAYGTAWAKSGGVAENALH